MANEEIVVSLGLNSNPFSRGLQSSLLLGNQFASGMKKNFEDIGSSIKQSIAGILTAEGLNRLGEWSESIKRTGEISGTSTDFVQHFGRVVVETGGDVQKANAALEKLAGYIGQAASGVSSATTKFKDAGISITDAGGNIKSTEQVLRELADRMADAKTRTEATGLAFDVWGAKIGGELVPALSEGSKGLDKFNDSMTLSKQDLDSLTDAMANIKMFFVELTTWVGKAIGSIAEFFRLLGFLGEYTKAHPLYNLRDLDAALGAFTKQESAEAAASKNKQAALDLQTKKASEFAKQSETLNSLAREREAIEKANAELQAKTYDKHFAVHRLLLANVDLEDEIRRHKDDQVANAERQIEMAKNNGEILRLNNEIEKDTTEQKKQQKDLSDKTKQMQDSYNDLTDQKQEEQQKGQEEQSQQGAQYPTIEGLANFRGRRNQYNNIASNILKANEDQIQARAKGNIGRAENDRNYVNNAMGYLASQGVISPQEFQKQQTNDAIMRIGEAMDRLMDLANGAGVPIRPKMGH